MCRYPETEIAYRGEVLLIESLVAAVD
jgi:hypothetical protein